METAALNRPPAWAERLVLLFTPPAAREAVVGDLCETYRTPSQYAGEALRTVPFVIASQMRRNANLPALGLQGFLVFFGLGGFGQSGPLSGTGAALSTALVLLALVVRDAYQATARQPSHRAMVEAILAVIAMLVCALILTSGMQSVLHLTEDDLRGLRFAFLAPFLFPLLCIFRTGLIVEGDRRPPFADEDLSQDLVMADYRRFARRVLWRNRIEAAALAGFAVLVILLREKLNLPGPVTAPALLSIYVLAAVYLLIEGRVHALPPRTDFLSLRALYQQEMTRQHQLRRFLWWLWFAPLLLALHAELIQTGFATRRPILVATGTVAALMLCFFISALNREHGGRVREKAGLLDRVWQKNA